MEDYPPLRIGVGEYGQVIVQKRISLFWMSSVVVVIGQESDAWGGSAGARPCLRGNSHLYPLLR